MTGFNIYQKALAKNTVLDRDGRSMFVKSYASRASDVAKLKEPEVNSITAFAIEMAEKNIVYNAGDSMMQMERARVYDSASRIVKDEAKKEEYALKALESIEGAIAVSPQRIPLYFVKAQFLVGLGRIDEAIASLEYASTFNEDFFETSCQLGQIYLLQGNMEGEQDKTALSEKGYQELDKCLNNGGGDLLAVEGVIIQAINHYSEKEDLDKVLQLYEQLINFRQKDPAVWKNLAMLYAKAGNIDRAEKAANVAAQIDPSLRNDVDEFIRQLHNK
jgi:tetratricopeptide (TPR) repeat protein